VGEIYQNVDMTALIANSKAGGKLAIVNVTVGRHDQPAKLEAGLLTCTYLVTDYEMADGDLVTLGSRDEWGTENRIRDRGNFGSDTDILRYFPILEIQVVVSQHAKEPVTSDFYQVSADGRGITFPNDAAVAPGEQYTVRYRFRPQWTVVEDSHSRQIEATNGDRFPNTCLLRMWQGLELDSTAADMFTGAA